MEKNKKIISMAIAIAIVLLGLKFFWAKKKLLAQSKSGIIIDMKKAVQKDNIVPILIIGSGCAGLSSAIYGARSNIHTVLLKGNTPGGQLTETSYVENWPGSKKELGSELIERLKTQAESFGAILVNDSATSIDGSQWPYQVTTEEGKKINALTIIMATGASPRKLGVAGEKEYWGKGVTTCAICDAPFHKGQDVVVVGGGDSAAEEATQLSPYAKSVTILVRKDAMRASAVMQDRLKEIPNITIQFNTEVKKILGDGQVVTGVELYDNTTGATLEKEVTGVFLAIGHDPNSKLVKSFLKTDEQGYIEVQGRTQLTSMPGIFAAGDVEDFIYRQAGVAAGSGIKAALDAGSFLQSYGFNKDISDQMEARFYQGTQAIGIEIKKMSNLKELEEIISKSKIPVILDFYTPFCPSCIQMLPSLEEMAQKYAERIVIYKIDASEAVDIAKKYKIGAVPVLLTFKEGSLVKRINKALSKKELDELISGIM